MPLIFAAGPLTPDGTPVRHYATAADAPPLLAGDAAAAAAAGGAVVQGEEDEENGSLRAVSCAGRCRKDKGLCVEQRQAAERASAAGRGLSGLSPVGLLPGAEHGPPPTPLQAHAWLAAIGWGVLVPAGIVMARRWGGGCCAARAAVGRGSGHWHGLAPLRGGPASLQCFPVFAHPPLLLPCSSLALRSFKHLDAAWFHLHRILQVGFCLPQPQRGVHARPLVAAWPAASGCSAERPRPCSPHPAGAGFYDGHRGPGPGLQPGRRLGGRELE